MKQNQKIVSYILIILSLFIILLFTKGAYSELQANQDNLLIKEEENTKKRAEIEKLNSYKTGENAAAEKYITDFREDNLIAYLYNITEKTNTSKGTGSAFIESISITPPKQNELGFLEADISLSLQVGSRKKMEQILTTLISEDAVYKFFIPSFRYENTTSNNLGAFSVNIPLKVFYK